RRYLHTSKPRRTYRTRHLLTELPQVPLVCARAPAADDIRRDALYQPGRDQVARRFLSATVNQRTFQATGKSLERSSAELDPSRIRSSEIRPTKSENVGSQSHSLRQSHAAFAFWPVRVRFSPPNRPFLHQNRTRRTADSDQHR